MVFVEVASCCRKAVIDNMQMIMHGCVPVQFYLQKQVLGWIWPEGQIADLLSSTNLLNCRQRPCSQKPFS